MALTTGEWGTGGRGDRVGRGERGVTGSPEKAWATHPHPHPTPVRRSIPNVAGSQSTKFYHHPRS